MKKSLKQLVNLWRFSISDAMRLYRSETSRLGKISVGAHVLERGLALPTTKPWFGKGELKHLGGNIHAYLGAGGSPEACELKAAYGALLAYVNHFSGEGGECKDMALSAINLLSNAGVTPKVAGKVEVSRAEFLAGARHSVRHYTDEVPSAELLLQAVTIAQTCPSVCNRQSGRAHLFLGKEAAKKALDCHIGAGGFRENVLAVAVITSDLRTFHGPEERYQGWIDGGLFLMQFLNGLHKVGLGACPLNWSVGPWRDELLRKTVAIPAHERVIALVSIGHLPDTVKYAMSPRKAVGTIATFHQ